MADYCYLVYDYERQIPTACFDKLRDLSGYLGKTKATVSSSITRQRKGLEKYTKDRQGRKYQIFKVYGVRT